MIMRHFAILLAVASCLAACGTKGPLVPPPKPAPTQQSAPAPAAAVAGTPVDDSKAAGGTAR